MKLMEFLKKVSATYWAILVAALALLAGVLMLPQNVAQAVDLEPYSAAPQYAIQELRAWGQGQVSLADEPITMSGYKIYRYKLDQSLLEQYIAMLQENGFTLAG